MTTTSATAAAGTPQPPLEVRLEVLAQAIGVLTGFAASLADATSEQLSKALEVLDRVAVLAAAGRVAVTAARAQRSPANGRRRTARTADWVREHAPSQRSGGAGQVARAADLLDEPGLAPVGQALLGGKVSPGVALSVMNAFERVRPWLADPGSAPIVLQSLVDTAECEGMRALNGLVTQLLESYGSADAVQEDQNAAATRVSLSRGIEEAGGTTRYDLIADSISRAILEAAIGPLSRPIPSPDGSPDPRSAEHRRGQALFEVCRRVSQAPGMDPEQPDAEPSHGAPFAAPSSTAMGEHTHAASPGATSSGCATQAPSANGTSCRMVGVDVAPGPDANRDPGPGDATTSRASGHDTASATPASDACEPSPPTRSQPQTEAAGWPRAVPDRPGPKPRSVTDVPAGVKTILFVMMTLDDLVEGTGTAMSVGPLGFGSRIGPQTARRLACDAGIIPVVLGSQGEVLDLGRQSRLFTYAQVKALWLRDKHCTYPGCDVPPFWTDAHHLRHWADGGPSDLSNAALLCGPHHDTIHRNRLAGTVRPDGTGVQWNLTAGSYGVAPEP